MITENYGNKFVVRFLEIIPGLFVWTALFFPVIFSFSYPTWVAYFIIVFDLYWLFKAFYMSRNLLVAYNRMIVEQNTDWLVELEKTTDIENYIKEKKDLLAQRK